MICNVDIQIGALNLVFAIICAFLASARGRNPIGWFLLGLLISCIAFILLIILPDLKEEAQRLQRRDKETRRLREQLKKERHVSDERHRVQRARLEAHDQRLGLDTGEAERRLIDEGLAPPPLTDSDAPPAAGASSPDTLWFHGSGGVQNGPIPEFELRDLLRRRQLDGDTLVWHQGMIDWMPANEVPELRDDLPS